MVLRIAQRKHILYNMEHKTFLLSVNNVQFVPNQYELVTGEIIESISILHFKLVNSRGASFILCNCIQLINI